MCLYRLSCTREPCPSRCAGEVELLCAGCYNEMKNLRGRMFLFNLTATKCFSHALGNKAVHWGPKFSSDAEVIIQPLL